MTRRSLTNLTSDELVDEFARNAIAQDAADLKGRISEYNRLFREMTDVANELKNREGDRRIQLTRLYADRNVHVRMQAAKFTLAVARDEARAQLQSIVDSNWFPQAGDAGMCLLRLERGEFKPD